MQIQENVPLAPLTTFRIGGSARHFVCVQNIEELKQSLDFARDQNLATLILGGGSNMLIDDAGWGGLVIKIELRGMERVGDTLIASAGESWDALVLYAVGEGLWGIENLSGIPGTVGAAPIQNIGAYGAEVSDTLLWVEVLERSSGEVVRIEGIACGFRYRSSIFKREPERYILLRAAFALTKEGTPHTSYAGLADMQRSTLDEIRQKVLAIRSKKFPDLSQEGTAGSFFLNPLVSPDAAARLAAHYEGLPCYPTAEGTKLSLAWLLDHVLGVKGMEVGGARLYEAQPLVVVARAGARASDVRALAKKIKNMARERLELEIEEEVRIISAPELSTERK